MDDREKLQREVIAGLDTLEQLVQEEQRHDASNAVPTTEQNTDDREEASNLKKQLEELHGRFIDLRARIEAREDMKSQPSPAEVSSSELQRVQSTEVPPDHRVEGRAPSLLEKKIWSSQLLKQAPPSRVAALIALLVGGLAAWLGSQHLSSGVAQVAIGSEPAEAGVYIDNQFRGQTPVRLKSIQAGSHRVRITKEGYEPLIQELRLGRGETAHLDVRLNELSAAQLHVLARSLFDQNKLREADRICTLLLQEPPYDAFALDLREKILTGLLAQISSEGLPAKKSSVPAREERSRSGKLPRPESRFAQNGKVIAAATSQSNRASTNPTAPRLAVQPASQSRRLPPENREPMSQVSATNPTHRQPDPINPEVLDRIKSRIQSRNFAEARALLQQLPVSSEPVLELKNLIERAETDARRQQNLVSSTLQKAESALILGRYIAPPDDNVVIHCNRGLSFDPQNQKLLALKKDVIHRSIAQARDWIQRGRFEQARASYSSLNYLSQNDTGFPVHRQWFQEELNKLEFTSYPVIHEHKFGSCSGRLRMNAHVLSFVPSGDSFHGFTEPLQNVKVAETGGALKVRLDGKSYEFHANSNQDSASSRQAFQAAYEQLMNLVAKATH